MIHLIAAVGLKGQIGLNGELPWHDTADLQWFREVTQNKALICGPNTYPTIAHLGGSLNREVVVFRRGDSVKAWIDHYAELNRDIAIVGGAWTYGIWYPYVERFHISRINYVGPADVWMPNIDWRTMS